MQKAMKSKITIFEENPTAFEVSQYDSDEKKKIIAYMQAFDPYAASGEIFDCVTGIRLDKEDVGYTDGEFMWTSQDIYHIEKYNAAITNDFRMKIMK